MNEITIRDINGLIYDEGKIYMISTYFPILMVYDFETRKVEKLCDYPQDVRRNSAFEKIIKSGSKIFLFPCRADSIYYYDMQTQKYTKLLSLNSIEEKMPERKFFEVLEHDGFIYAVCRSPNLVICIDPIDDAVRIWKLEEKIEISDRIILCEFPVRVYDNKLFYPYSSDIIIEFNICDKKFQVIHMIREKEEYDEKYSCLTGMVVSDSGKQWVYDWYGNLYEIINNKMIKIELPPELNGVYNDGQYEEAPRINSVLFCRDKLYFILQSDSRVLVYDISSNSFAWIVNTFTAWRRCRRKLAYTIYTQMHANDFLLYDYNDGRIYVWNLNDGFCDEIELNFLLTDAVDMEHFNYYIFARDDLELYMQYVEKNSDDKVEKDKKCFGERIYSVLTSESTG